MIKTFVREIDPWLLTEREFLISELQG